MRRPRRDIQIFSLSALDILATATGVFVLLLVLLMPYYRKTFDAAATIDAVRVESDAVAADLEALERSGAVARKRAGATAAAAARLDAQAAALERSLRAAAPPVPPAAGAEDRVIDALDLIFVIDTTASMRPVIRDLALSLRGVVRILERLVPSVRVAVVAYKDRDTGLPPVVALPLTPTDPKLQRIIGFVEDLEASTASSRTIEEDVHLGIETATQMPLRAGARQSLVVIGDAAVHDALREATVRRVANFVRAKPERTVSSLFTSTPSSRSRGDRARPFFQALAAAGHGSFNDHAGSMTESVLLSVLVADNPRDRAAEPAGR